MRMAACPELTIALPVAETVSGAGVTGRTL